MKRRCLLGRYLPKYAPRITTFLMRPARLDDQVAAFPGGEARRAGIEHRGASWQDLRPSLRDLAVLQHEQRLRRPARRASGGLDLFQLPSGEERDPL
jgi:hypothetical protein